MHGFACKGGEFITDNGLGYVGYAQDRGERFANGGEVLACPIANSFARCAHIVLAYEVDIVAYIDLDRAGGRAEPVACA